MAPISLDATRVYPAESEQAAASSLSTICGACPELCWFVVLTEWQQEQLARHECARLGAQVFAPLVRILVPQRNRPAIRQLQPAFPGYLFVLVAPAAIARLRYARGVAGLLYEVGQAVTPAIVPTHLMDAMLARATIQGVLERKLDRDLPAWVVGEEPAPADPTRAKVKRQWRALADLADMGADDRLRLLHDIVGGA